MLPLQLDSRIHFFLRRCANRFTGTSKPVFNLF